MNTSNGLLLGVRNEIARMWKSKNDEFSEVIKPVNQENAAFHEGKKAETMEIHEEKKPARFMENAPASSRAPMEKRPSGEPTVIGEHMAIEGTIRADEDIIIEGTLKGSIVVKSHQLTIGQKGRIEADIEAASVVIAGRITGNVAASDKVRITRTADFCGQIKAKSIAVEDGAFLKASIELYKEATSRQGPQRTVDALVFDRDARDQKTPKIDPSKPNAQK
jgi:cytoskeletal protein CcmA (bactofilin family)